MSWCSVSASLNLKDFVSLNFETLDLEHFDPLTFTREASPVNLKSSYPKLHQSWATETVRILLRQQIELWKLSD